MLTLQNGMDIRQGRQPCSKSAHELFEAALSESLGQRLIGMFVGICAGTTANVRHIVKR